MILHKIFKTFSSTVPAALIITQVAFAQTVVSNAPSAAVTPFQDIGVLVGNVFAFVLIVASILLFLYLILGGVQWLTSGGDKLATQAARDRITAALTGLLIILAVWGVFRIIEAAFGISVLGGIKVPVSPQSVPFRP